MKHISKHQFAFYWPDISFVTRKLEIGQQFTLTNVELINRLTRVLRLKVDEQAILFDRTVNVVVKLKSIDKDAVIVLIEKITVHHDQLPHLTVIIPLLKKDALEHAVYFAVEAGVSEIMLVKTDKSQQVLTNNEIQRLHKIIIAAAEQSKNFIFPLMQEPVPLTHMHSYCSVVVKLLCDAQAPQKLKDVLSFSHGKHYVIAIGPEGDFTTAEKEFFVEQGFVKVSLTSTVLRAQDAVLVATSLVKHLT